MLWTTPFVGMMPMKQPLDKRGASQKRNLLTKEGVASCKPLDKGVDGRSCWNLLPKEVCIVHFTSWQKGYIVQNKFWAKRNISTEAPGMWNVSPFHPLLKGVACSLASLSDASQFWIWAISLKRIRHNIFKVKTNLIQNIYNYPRIFGVCFKNDIAQTKSAAITSWQKGYFVPATIESKRHPLLKEEQTPAQSWGWNKRDGRRWVEGSTDFNLGFQGWHSANCILFGHRLEAVSKRFQKYRQNQIWSNLIKIIVLVLIKFIKFDQI